MSLDGDVIMNVAPTEPIEVLAIHRTPEHHYVSLCNGTMIISPKVILEETQEGMVCHIKNNEGITLFEYPVAKNMHSIYF